MTDMSVVWWLVYVTIVLRCRYRPADVLERMMLLFHIQSLERTRLPLFTAVICYMSCVSKIRCDRDSRETDSTDSPSHKISDFETSACVVRNEQSNALLSRCQCPYALRHRPVATVASPAKHAVHQQAALGMEDGKVEPGSLRQSNARCDATATLSQCLCAETAHAHLDIFSRLRVNGT